MFVPEISLIVGIYTCIFPICEGKGTLVTLKSTKLTGPEDVVDSSDLWEHDRFKRDITNQERIAILKLHNDYRRNESSANMELMSWNSEMEELALGWARICDWSHGQPRQHDLYNGYLGQNLFITNGSYSSELGVRLWYEEKEFYDFNTGNCSKPPCGHYTQVVWSSSREVGCAHHYCPTLRNTHIIKARYLVCNYGPGGNIVGDAPYKKGPACSQCDSGQGWCSRGLCTGQCVESTPDCRCEARCNCGTVVDSTCSCICPPGWTGHDCTELCQDNHENCGANPGWPDFWCDRSYVSKNCPLLCGACVEANSTNRLEECVSGSRSFHSTIVIKITFMISFVCSFLYKELT